ncbi:MAG TPA: HAD family phosphatase [Pyrinomonadaceae bacterium]|jgi:HAD superfamily hydrolase (TIGR01509 family)|nr:HAD family phosphatase [Pyrinomonadaceae bacterium]
MIQAILFDFNGVIIDDEPVQLKAYQEVFGAEGVALSDEDYYGSLGMDDTTFVRTSFARVERPLTDELLRAVVERKTEKHRALLGDELPLFSGVATFIKALARRYPLALVSMARRVEIDYVLERASLARFFPVIVSAEDERPCKPDPYCYRRALELLNQARGEAHVIPLRPDECLVVEDSPPGIQSARAAGMRTLGVTNTVAESELRAAGADVVTHNLADWTTDAVHHVFDKR